MTACPTGRMVADYQAAPSIDARNAIVAECLPMLRAIASKTARRVRDRVDADELAQMGLFGLLDAIDSFDAGRGIRFATHATIRVRGAMLDAMRDTDWVPRLVRTRAKLLAATVAGMRDTLGREPEQHEIRAALGSEADIVINDSVPLKICSFSRVRGECHSGRVFTELHAFVDQRFAHDIEAVDGREAFERLMRYCTRTERLVMKLRYIEGFSFPEIGRVVGVSFTRISQLHAAAVRRIKTNLTKQAAA